MNQTPLALALDRLNPVHSEFDPYTKRTAGVDATGKHEVVAWRITGPDHSNHPVLTLLPPDDADQLRKIFFIKPVIAAMKMAHAQ